MVTAGSIDLEPTFQRRARWNRTDQSQLIESFLLNVPVPPVYLSETDYGNYSVIDGKQRINSITKFMRNELKLVNLDDFDDIEGCYFDDLPRPLKNALSVRPYVRVISLLRQSKPELKFEVFTRLNRGGEELNAQEIRNVVYRGELNDMIYKLSENGFLRQQLKIDSQSSAAYRTMKDARLVLRFLMLSKRWKSFAGNFREEMNNFMEKYSGSDQNILEELKSQFNRSIRYSEIIWGRRAFQRPDNGSWRNQLLSGMYDAQMVAINEVSDEILDIVSRKESNACRTLRKVYYEDPHLEDYVRQATNSPERVKYRIQTMIDVIKRIAKRTTS